MLKSRSAPGKINLLMGTNFNVKKARKLAEFVFGPDVPKIYLVNNTRKKRLPKLKLKRKMKGYHG